MCDKFYKRNYLRTVVEEAKLKLKNTDRTMELQKRPQKRAQNRVSIYAVFKTKL